MKIVYLHNYYIHRGGEDISFENDLSMLREEGHEVIPFTRHNKDFVGNPLSLASKTLWNRETERDLAEVLEQHRPDVVHCNNLFPQISASVYRSAKRKEIPVVQALRNYRSFCSSSYLYREEKICHKCLKSPIELQGIRHACYRDSRAASTVVAALQGFHRLTRIRQRYVDAFVTPSEFSRQIHIEGGFDPENLYVRPNFILPDLGVVSHPTLPQGAVFVGRLSTEKGIDTLIDAWTKHEIDMPLTIVGEGVIEDELKRQAADHPHIQFVGQKSTNEVLEIIGNAACLVMTSRWYETFGRTIVESFSRGTPVIASRLGAMAELVDSSSGLQFDPGDSDSLAGAVKRFRSLSPDAHRKLRADCRVRYEENFSRKQSYQQLMWIYQKTLTGLNPQSPVLDELNERLDPGMQSVTAPKSHRNKSPMKPNLTNTKL